MTPAREQPTQAQTFRPRQAELLLRLIGLRLAVVTTVLLCAYLVDLFTGGRELDLAVLLQTTGLAYIASLIYLIARVLWPRAAVVQTYLQFFGDLLLVSYLVARTDGAASPFSSLYLVVITVASTLLRRRYGVVVATWAWLIFTAVSVAGYRSWLPESWMVEAPTLARLVYALIIHLVGFYAIALLTSFLARGQASAELKLEETSDDLAQLEELHRYVVDSMPSGLITTDLEARITSINPAGTAILGRTRDQVMGEPVYECGLLDEEEWEQYAHWNEGQQIRYETELELGGEVRFIGFSIADLKDPIGQPRGHTLVFQDLTPWQRLREQLRRNDRMAALGEMASGLAHEIGNPLAAISGSVQVLSKAEGRTESEAQLLSILLAESNRLDRTIKSFLAYASPKPRSVSRFDIGRLLIEHCELLRHSPEVADDHQVVCETDGDGVEIEADRDQVLQVLWNLSRNGLRAMPDGGTLRIMGERIGESYSIRFADTGIGMSAEQRERLFQPFQSFFDGGTGIGMAIVYRIVEEHEGTIEADSDADGTTIHLSLPLRSAGLEAGEEFLEVRTG